MESYQLLEHRWAEFIGRDPGLVVACSSGTAALHLALEALKVRPFGSEVVVPDFTMVACARSVVMAGLMPRFVDCDKTLLMDDGDPFGNVTVEPYSAFMGVHVYGRRLDMDWIHSVVNSSPVIEDMAEIHGVNPHPDTEAACWSFYRNKIIGGEEGGAIAFKEKDVATYARQLRSLGMTPSHDFIHHPRGHNYRLANSLAERILLAVEGYGSALARRRAVSYTHLRAHET